MIDFTTFEGLDLRVGTVFEANDFPEAKNLPYQLQIDFGPLGILNSSAQITNDIQKREFSSQTDHCCSKLALKKLHILKASVSF